jgi:hypothetical protein
MKTLQKKPVQLVPKKDKPERKNFAAALAKLGKVGEKQEAKTEAKPEKKPDVSGPYNAKMLALARSRLLDRDPKTEAAKAEAGT